MKMFLLTDDIDALIGNRMAGIKGLMVKSDYDFCTKFKDKVCQKENAIILITQSLARKNQKVIDEYKKIGKVPFILEIPARFEYGMLKIE